jgi:hypothetical protein
MHGGVSAESELHEHFKSHIVRGEWFYLSEQIEDYIRRNTIQLFWRLYDVKDRVQFLATAVWTVGWDSPITYDKKCRLEKAIGELRSAMRRDKLIDFGVCAGLPIHDSDGTVWHGDLTCDDVENICFDKMARMQTQQEYYSAKVFNLQL